MSKTQTEQMTLRIGHSPDPDDAFMWYPLADFTGPDGQTYKPRIDTGSYRFVHVLEDIQALNERTEKAELEITALSIHQLPYVADRYALTSCGASMGDGYGPMLVARENFDLAELVAGKRRLAIPGERTSAWLGFQLLLREAVSGDARAEQLDYDVVPFDRIIEQVQDGTYDAGLIIHEGQLTYRDAGLTCIEDLGAWWKRTRGLPLPLGGNAIRRDLGERMPEVCAILYESIRYALEHRDEAVRFALNYARDMDQPLADEFVGMYVNETTLDYGDAGRRAVERFLGEAVEAGLVPDRGPVEFIAPAERL